LTKPLIVFEQFWPEPPDHHQNNIRLMTGLVSKRAENLAIFKLGPPIIAKTIVFAIGLPIHTPLIPVLYIQNANGV